MTIKKPSLRSRLRNDAAEQLSALVVAGTRALAKIGNSVSVNAADLAKMIGSKQTDTLRAKLVTQLADRKEADLEKIDYERKAEESKK